MKLKEEFEIVVNKYMGEFCVKQDMNLFHWIGCDVGETVNIGDYYFNFDDIRRDIDQNVPVGVILDWYNESLEAHYENETQINYRSYLMGARFPKKIDKK
jgi:hypothetical protein